MKKEELIAKNYLLSIGYVENEIKYEPLGRNTTPDFSIKDKIAVEVRRLNKNININGKSEPEPIENLNFKILPNIYKILNDFPNDNYHHSAYVCITYSRPLDTSEELYNQIKSVLISHREFIDEEKIYSINDNFKIKIFPASIKYDKLYILGFQNDLNTSGFTVYDMYENIKLVISKKEKKIIKHYDKFEEWWLILIDDIGWGLYCDVFNNQQQFHFPKNIFGKILIIPPY